MNLLVPLPSFLALSWIPNTLLGLETQEDPAKEGKEGTIQRRGDDKTIEGMRNMVYLASRG